MADHGKKDDERGKPDDSHGKAKDGGASITDSFKTGVTSFLEGDFLKDATRSGAQPTLRRRAEMLAKHLRSFFPSDHPLRSDVSEAVIDFVGDRIRRIAEGRKTWGGVAVTEIGEFIKMLGEEFCNEENGDGSKAPEKKQAPVVILQPKLQDALTEAGVSLVNDAAELIKATPPSGKEAMDAIQLGRADSLWKLQDRLVNGPQKPEAPKEPGVPFSERLSQCGEAVERTLKPFNEELERDIAQLKANTARKKAEQQAKRAAKPNTLQEKIWRWLF